jgi:hypothetical protein
MDAGLSPGERIAVASALELLPAVGMLAAMENQNLVWIAAPLVLLSGAGWASVQRYQWGALFLFTRVMLVVVPFLLIGVYTSGRCDESCTWHQAFGSVWPLWITALFAQPLFSALALASSAIRRPDAQS